MAGVAPHVVRVAQPGCADEMMADNSRRTMRVHFLICSDPVDCAPRSSSPLGENVNNPELDGLYKSGRDFGLRRD